jgi:hypothetical protein
MPNSWRKWADDLLARNAGFEPAQLADFGRRMWSGEFVLSVTREFVASCGTPMLILPGNDLEHPAVIARKLAELVPHALTVTPWKEPADVVPSAVAQVRAFLREHSRQGL